MACETAVVASNVGGIPEVVADGKTGVLVEYTKDAPEFEKRLAKAINDVMSNTELAVSMGKAGRKRAVEEFGWDKVAQQTIDLYRSVIK
jgi:starch synthase